MTSRAPCSAASPASEAAGCTWSVEPTATNTSHAFATAIASPSTSWSRACPNITVAAFGIPPHARHAGSGTPASIRSSASSIDDRARHAVHSTARAVPCSSHTLRSGMPPAWCSPATFCVITRTANPSRRSSSATARCAASGAAPRAAGSRRISHDLRRISGSAR